MGWWRHSSMILLFCFLDLMLIIIRVLSLSWFQINSRSSCMINVCNSLLDNFCSCRIFSWWGAYLSIISKRVLMFTINKLPKKIFMILHLLFDHWRLHLERNIILLIFWCGLKTCWVNWINLSQIIFYFVLIFTSQHYLL